MWGSFFFDCGVCNTLINLILSQKDQNKPKSTAKEMKEMSLKAPARLIQHNVFFDPNSKSEEIILDR